MGYFLYSAKKEVTEQQKGRLLSSTAMAAVLWDKRSLSEGGGPASSPWRFRHVNLKGSSGTQDSVGRSISISSHLPGLTVLCFKSYTNLVYQLVFYLAPFSCAWEARRGYCTLRERGSALSEVRSEASQELRSEDQQADQHSCCCSKYLLETTGRGSWRLEESNSQSSLQETNDLFNPIDSVILLSFFLLIPWNSVLW